MNVPKPTAEDRARFTALAPNTPGVEGKPMSDATKEKIRQSMLRRFGKAEEQKAAS